MVGQGKHIKERSNDSWFSAKLPVYEFEKNKN